MGVMLRSRWIVMLLLLCACATRQTGPYALDAPEPIVERYGEDRVVIRWDAAPRYAPIRVYAGTAPDRIDRTRSVAEMTGKNLYLRLLKPATRVFFELEPLGAEPRIIGERLLPLEGAQNFRDLGGYVTDDGRRVRWGMLYRSDDLADLTRDDLRYVSKLGINLVCDFRGAEERASEPSRLPEMNPPDVANLDIADDRFDPNAIETMIRARSVDGVDFGEMLVEGNRAFATRFSPQYASMFERIAVPENLPTLVHCSGGKDRTGFASAIVLRALGVPEETVFEDYLLTNVYTANKIERQLMLLRMYLLFRTRPEAIRPLLGVRRATTSRRPSTPSKSNTEASTPTCARVSGSPTRNGRACGRFSWSSGRSRPASGAAGDAPRRERPGVPLHGSPGHHGVMDAVVERALLHVPCCA